MAFAEVFTRPSFELFRTLMCAWVLSSGRRTVTGMIRAMDPHGRPAHDAYHRFLRARAWKLAPLWRILLVQLVEHLDQAGVLQFDLDDTLFHKSGRKIEGAGVPRRRAFRSQGRGLRPRAESGGLDAARFSTVGWGAAGAADQRPLVQESRAVALGLGRSDDPTGRGLAAGPFLCSGLRWGLRLARRAIPPADPPHLAHPPGCSAVRAATPAS